MKEYRTVEYLPTLDALKIRGKWIKIETLLQFKDDKLQTEYNAGEQELIIDMINLNSRGEGNYDTRIMAELKYLHKKLTDFPGGDWRGFSY